MGWRKLSGYSECSQGWTLSTAVEMLAGGQRRQQSLGFSPARTPGARSSRLHLSKLFWTHVVLYRQQVHSLSQDLILPCSGPCHTDMAAWPFLPVPTVTVHAWLCASLGLTRAQTESPSGITRSSSPPGASPLPAHLHILPFPGSDILVSS